MEEKYWEKFAESGKVMDYLYYRGLSICHDVMQNYSADSGIEKETGENRVEPDNGYGNGIEKCSYR